jgi:hypothetical protein
MNPVWEIYPAEHIRISGGFMARGRMPVSYSIIDHRRLATCAGCGRCTGYYVGTGIVISGTGLILLRGL